MEKQYPQYKPQKQWRKDQENIIMITITITNITMTMIETVGQETGINHTTEIDHIVEIDHETTIKITIEMIIEMITETTMEMTIEKKILGILKNRNIRESIEIIMKTHMKTGTTRIIIEIVTKTKIEIKTKTNMEMTVMTKLEVGLKKKSAHMMIEKMIVLKQNLKRVHKFCKQLVRKKK